MAPIDSTGWDYLVFVITILVSAWMVIIGGFLVWYRRSDAIRSRNIRLLLPMCVFGTIWVWSVTISDEHISGLHSMRVASCALWSFWGELVLGGNAWLTALVLRINIYYQLFTLKPSRTLRTSVLCVILYTLPMFIVSVGVTALHGSYVDDTTGHCRTQLGWKVSAIVIAAINVVALVCFAYALTKHIPAHFKKYNEGKELTVGIVIGLIGIATAIMVNVTGQTDLVYGRVIRTLAINVTVFAFMTAVCGRPIWKTMWNDATYLSEQVAAVGFQALPSPDALTFARAMRDEHLRLHFRDFIVETKPIVTIEIYNPTVRTNALLAPGDDDDTGTGAFEDEEEAEGLLRTSGELTEIRILAPEPFSAPMGAGSQTTTSHVVHATHVFACYERLEPLTRRDAGNIGNDFNSIVIDYIMEGAAFKIPTPRSLFAAIMAVAQPAAIRKNPAAMGLLLEWIQKQIFKLYWGDYYAAPDGVGINAYEGVIQRAQSISVTLQAADLENDPS